MNEPKINIQTGIKAVYGCCPEEFWIIGKNCHDIELVFIADSFGNEDLFYAFTKIFKTEDLKIKDTITMKGLIYPNRISKIIYNDETTLIYGEIQ